MIQKTSTASYLVWDLAAREAAIIDAVLDFDQPTGKLTTASANAMLSRACALELKFSWVLEPHAHADHLSAADYIRRKPGAKPGIGAGIKGV